MNSRAGDPVAPSPLARFLERVQKSFSHDLRTPLGTIVNYAAVLEASQGAEAEEVRDIGRRIRGSAQRLARMVQMLATATRLASRPLRSASTDLVALAKAVLTEGQGRGTIRLPPGLDDLTAPVDPEVLGYAWRAYVAVESDAAGHPVDDAEIRLVRGPDEVLVELRCEAGSASHDLVVPDTRLELPNYLRLNGGPARLENSMGLSLAQDLVLSHGGDLEVWGRPGERSGLRVRFLVAA